ncbi:ABC transporter ATP-binding protein [Mycoplasmopsis synoviae]|uniref:ABC transporter ATP-binding protein n=1 Tax=Mycoplasmopsis synoviae TaxID=2109 RepID=UPI001C587E0C|nr:ABC transporter ATP-binding protein [Mycoplasmopsis synoviae]QXV99309.1 ABC transporter ATP-binding protein/permease [Mycoplasmopsis synoviae]UBM43492.1 ABC transporter ATP-binding protein/permease [Mycoplasmopsis synoviae]UZW63606.1 ABC transporter ATP-binding protein/permease [Mycoplasmopsis synoviae]
MKLKKLNKSFYDKSYYQSEKIPTRKILKTLFKYVLYYKKELYIAIVYSLLQTVFYTIGAFLVGKIIGIFFEPIIYGQKAISDFGDLNFFFYLLGLSLCFILYAIFRYLELRSYIDISYKTTQNLRKEIYHKLQNAPLYYLDTKKDGDLITLLIIDINNVSNSLFQTISGFFNSLLSLIFAIVAMNLVSSLLSLIVMPTAFLIYFSVFLYIRRSQKHFHANTQAFARLNSFVKEMLNNAKVTNVFHKQKFVHKNLKKITNDIQNISYKGDVISRSFDIFYSWISNLLILLISALCVIFYLNKTNVYGVYGFGVDDEGKATVSLIVTYIAINWSFMVPFQGFLSMSFTIQNGIASGNRIFKILDIPQMENQDSKINIKDVVGEIVFDNVYFKYQNSNKHQLLGVSFTAKPNTITAIVGPTGAGKSTIIGLISQFYNYEKGHIYLDGIELKDISNKSLIENTTMILQDCFLFNESVYENLKIVNPEANKEDVVSAAEITNANEFILNMEDSYKSIIKNNGQNISHGQKQLLNITRALVSNKKIVIFDEATSNIDSKTEMALQNSFNKLMKNKTVFIIAHRLSTVKNADNILVVNDGKIIESGPHKALLKQKGFYFNLYYSQFNK